MKSVTAVALLVLTVGTILVMWQSAFWAMAGPETGAFILAGVWLAACAVRAKELRFDWVLIPFAAVVLWPFLQLGLGTTVYRWATSAAILYWTAGAAIVFVSLQIFDDPGIRRRYLRALLITGFVISVISPLQLFTAQGKIFGYLKGLAAT